MEKSKNKKKENKVSVPCNVNPSQVKLSQRSTASNIFIMKNPESKNELFISKRELYKIEQIIRPLTRGDRQAIVQESRPIKKLNKELNELKLTKKSFCTYINSFQINNQLNTIKKTFKGTHKEKTIKCVNKLVSLHLQRLNMENFMVNKKYNTKEPINEISFKRRSSLGLEPNDRFQRKNHFSNSIIRSKPLSVKYSPIKKKFNIVSHKKTNLVKQIERGCIQSLDENVDMKSMLNKTEKMYKRDLTKCKEALNETIGMMRKSKIIISGTKNSNSVIQNLIISDF